MGCMAGPTTKQGSRAGQAIKKHFAHQVLQYMHTPLYKVDTGTRNQLAYILTKPLPQPAGAV